jgi:hypothetical protein
LMITDLGKGGKKAYVVNRTNPEDRTRLTGLPAPALKTTFQG